MVSVIPQDSPFDLIGKMIGENVSANLPGAFERGMERGQIQKGLDSLKNMTSDQLANMTPLQAISAVLGPFAGTRQGAQYAEALIPEVTKLLRSGQQIRPETGNALGAVQDLINSNQGQKLPDFMQKPGQVAGPSAVTPSAERAAPAQPPTFEQILPQLQKGLGEKYFPNVEPSEKVSEEEGFRPLKPLKPPLPFTPEAERKMRAILAQSGVTDEALQTQYINQAKQYQKDIYGALKEGRANVQDYQKERQLEDERFWNFVQPQLNDLYGTLNPTETNLFRGIARVNENAGTDESRLRNTVQQFDQIIRDPLAQFEQTGPILPNISIARPGQVQENLDSARSSIQDHLNSVQNINDQFWPKDLKDEATNFLRDSYMTSMLSKDWGTSQAAYAVSNLSDKVKNQMPKAPPPPKRMVAPGGVGGILSEAARAPQSQFKTPFERDESINGLANFLAKNLKPSDSLILAREQALQNNFDESMFRQALQVAMRNGLQLSNFQRNERPKLDIPQRLDLDSIMNGKRSIWDFFKRKQ